MCEKLFRGVTLAGVGEVLPGSQLKAFQVVDDYNQDLARLEIAMNGAALMCVVNGLADAGEKPQVLSSAESGGWSCIPAALWPATSSIAK
jgi:hypothetical protein